MDGDRMKRRGHKSFWRQKQFMIAVAIMVIAAVGMTGLYMASREKKDGGKIAEAEDTEIQQVAEKETEEPAESVTKVLTPKKEEVEEDTASIEGETETAEEDTEKAEDVMSNQAVNEQAEQELHFGAGSGLNWPLQGDVILNYSMDQTVYFATLDQYKYNPAVIISGSVSDRVSSAAPGRIADISTNEVTGCTVTVDLGDGYSAIYGQLKEVPYQVGDYVESGSTIGFISEPTKYYSVEGSNLYFELQKDGTPVNPVEFFQ